MIAQRRDDTYLVFRDMQEIYNSYKYNRYRISLLQSFFPHSQRSPGASVLFLVILSMPIEV